jgi:Pvc16 N-terminal domain
MSTALAIGAVSAVLRNILDNGVIDAVPAVGSPVTVSAKAPDLIKLDDPNAGPQLNLFLYAVSHNAGWRNASLPSRDAGGSRVANPQLALDLHYLLTAYGRDDLQAEILLGYAMHLLHERPFLDRATIRKALQLGPVPTDVLPSAFDDPPNAGLADQFETLKITWAPMDVDALSKLWTAIQTHFRPSAAFEVSVVLIEADRAASAPLPVLTRGPYDSTLGRDTGVVVTPSLVPPFPALDSASAADRTSVAELGEQITLAGARLDGTGATVSLGHRLLPGPHQIAVGTNADPSALQFTLPTTETAGQVWPAGIWGVTVTLTPPGEPGPRTTNAVPLMLAPVPDTSGVPAKPTATITRDGTTQRVMVSTGLTPAARPEQTVTLSLNGAQGTVGPRTAPTATVSADVGLAPPDPTGRTVLRIRVEGVESRSVDASGTHPVFRTDRQVHVP